MFKDNGIVWRLFNSSNPCVRHPIEQYFLLYRLFAVVDISFARNWDVCPDRRRATKVRFENSSSHAHGLNSDIYREIKIDRSATLILTHNHADDDRQNPEKNEAHKNPEEN